MGSEPQPSCTRGQDALPPVAVCSVLVLPCNKGTGNRLYAGNEPCVIKMQ